MLILWVIKYIYHLYFSPCLQRNMVSVLHLKWHNCQDVVWVTVINPKSITDLRSPYSVVLLYRTIPELLKKKEQCKSNCCVDSFVGERALVHGATRKGAKDEAGEFEPRKAWACEKAEAAAWGRWSAVSGAVQHTILRSQQHRAQQGTAAGAGGPCQKPGSWKGSCSNRQIVLFFPSSVHFKLNLKKNL